MVFRVVIAFLSHLGGFCINFSENMFKQDLCSEDRVEYEIIRHIPDLKVKIIRSAARKVKG